MDVFRIYSPLTCLTRRVPHSSRRHPDYKGGCNGAKIRFPPESEWESNANFADQVEGLEGVQPEDTSMADMIVLAGIMALEKTNPDLELACVSFSMPFNGNVLM